MTMQSVTFDGWTGFQRVNGDGSVSATATTDLIDILDAVDVPIVVVRRDFTVACFNQAAADVLGLSPSHIDRVPSDVAALAGIADLERRCTEIIAGGAACRADFRYEGKSFVVRIAPHGRQVNGTVLTFINVTAFRASIDQAIYEREYTKAILNTVADPIVVLGADQRIQSGNRAFHAMFRVSRGETEGVSIYQFGKSAFDIARLRAQMDEILAGGTAFQPIEVDYTFPEIGQRTLVLDARLLSLRGQSGRGILLTLHDITARKKAEQAQGMLIRELQHRVKNTLATIQAIASQTLHSASHAERDSFTARLHALANAHEVLTQDNWQQAPLRQVVDRALQPFQQGRITVAGPDLLLDAGKALIMTMALHELATNAVKYGALSNDDGRVRLDWTTPEAAEGLRLRLCWEEHGGPAVVEPERRGFGSRLIEASLEEAQVTFAPEGITCILEMSL